MIERRELSSSEVAVAIRATFSARNGHSPPTVRPFPPAIWADEFPAMAPQAGLSADDLISAFTTLSSYWQTQNLRE